MCWPKKNMSLKQQIFRKNENLSTEMKGFFVILKGKNLPIKRDMFYPQLNPLERRGNF